VVHHGIPLHDDQLASANAARSSGQWCQIGGTYTSVLATLNIKPFPQSEGLQHVHLANLIEPQCWAVGSLLPTLTTIQHKGKWYHTLMRAQAGAQPPLISFGYTAKSVTHGQCIARPMVTFALLVPDMTYNVFGGMLNLAQQPSQSQSITAL